MEHRTFPGIGAKVPLLGFGCMRFPRLPGDDPEAIDLVEAQKMVDYAMANGANYFDTAYVYGRSEESLGQLPKNHKRESYLLATKLPQWLMKDENDLDRIFDEQLARLQTDYFDFYLIHSLDAKKFPQAQAYKLYDKLAQKKKEGKIRYLGFSFHDEPEVLDEICAAHTWDFAQIQLNYMDWEDYKSRQQYEVLVKHNLPAIVMEPVHGGMLADLGQKANAVLQTAAPGKSIASWAVRYAASLPGVLCVLSGMSNMQQMEDNVASFAPFVPISPAEQTAIDEALELYRGGFSIPCTKCRYCMPCPVDINIPDLFSLYNAYAKNENMDEFAHQHAHLFGGHADACIACGQCRDICPQHFDIPALMEQIAENTPPEKLQIR